MSRSLELTSAAAALALLALPALADNPHLARPGELGVALTAEEVKRWDIDIRPDGQGLPPGQGTAEQGEQIWLERCAACHGDFGEGIDRWPVLMGGRGSLTGDAPIKTPGSYWPYATTIFDYIYRAMPFGDAQSLTWDETYALTAYILTMDEVIPFDAVMDAKTLPAVKMPNVDGFIEDRRPDVTLAKAGEPCMKDCAAAVTITGHARKIDVTPEEGAGGME